MLGQFLRTSAILAAALGAILLSETTGFCQGGGGGGNQNQDQNAGGIKIDANGVLTTRTQVDRSGRLNQQRLLAARASLNKDLQTPSPLRKISLTRLEKEVKKLIDAGKPIPPDMLNLAGMTRITHLFYYPETHDIVIAGPAEGYFLNADNHMVGMKSGAAILQLHDLIVALRAFNPEGHATQMISVSIDPTQEGIVRLNQTVKEINARAQAGQIGPQHTPQIVNAFCNALGFQQITIQGVSPKTHFAQVMVEADYRMKLIGIGLERPPVKIISFIDKATPSSASGLQRWYFQPNYDCVTVSDDHLSMELVGTGVQLVGEDESVDKDGNRKGKGHMNGASRAYCSSFTRNYEKLAKVSPLWGELRNLIDLSITAAFIQKMDLYEKAGWEMSVFGDESKMPVEIFNAPTQVAPIANAVMKSGSLLTPIAGGVTIQPRVALNSDRVTIDTEGKIKKLKNEIKLDHLGKSQWWWD